MSAVSRIKEIYGNLRDSQKKVAAFFLETDVYGIGNSIEDIALRIGTSAASISRFCKKLGYDTYGQFKLALSQDKSYEPDRVLPIFRPTDDEDLCIHKAFSEGVTNLKDTEQQLDFDTLKSAVKAMVRCRRLYFFGTGGSGAVGKLGEILFSHLGFAAQVLTDPYQMMMASGHLTGEDAAIGVSHSGATKTVVEAVRFAGERGAVTVAITNYRISALAKISTFVLETACYEGRVHFAQSNSMVAQMTILNAMYLLAATFASEEVIKEVNDIESIYRNSLRYK